MGSKNKVSIRHKTGANASFDSLISSIDVAREAFTQEIDAMRELADTRIDYDTFGVRSVFMSKRYQTVNSSVIYVYPKLPLSPRQRFRVCLQLSVECSQCCH